MRIAVLLGRRRRCQRPPVGALGFLDLAEHLVSICERSEQLRSHVAAHTGRLGAVCRQPSQPDLVDERRAGGGLVGRQGRPVHDIRVSSGEEEVLSEHSRWRPGASLEQSARPAMQLGPLGEAESLVGDEPEQIVAELEVCRCPTNELLQRRPRFGGGDTRILVDLL